MPSLQPKDKSKALLVYPTGVEAYRAWKKLGRSLSADGMPPRLSDTEKLMRKLRFTPYWTNLAPPSLVRMLTRFYHAPEYVTGLVVEYAQETEGQITNFDFVPELPDTTEQEP